MNAHLQALLAELDWLQAVIDQVIRSYLKHEGHENSYLDIPLVDLEKVDSAYAKLVNENQFGMLERLCLALTIAVELRPEMLDIFYGKNQLIDRPFTEFGGKSQEQEFGFIPSVQTFYFLAYYTAEEHRVEAMQLMQGESVLNQKRILDWGEMTSNSAFYNRRLKLASDWFLYLLNGTFSAAESSPDFPAEKVSSEMSWEDVVLPERVQSQLENLDSWLRNGKVIMEDWGLRKMLKAGYRALFHGPPGTGKTLTATLLGKTHGKEVYKVDLSMIVSKYIGETEKNLAKVFETAQDKDWILFFDEADALFGKRTAANSSNDRFANQQTAYLLQKIENYPGVVILASNLKSNLDEAFSRRFQSIVHFPMPEAEERYLLWQKAFSLGCQLEAEVDLRKIGEEYELAGGSIINVLRHAALKAVASTNQKVSYKTLIEGIREEYRKSNKTLSTYGVQ